MPFFSTVYIKTHAMRNRLFIRILAKTCDVILFELIHPCTQKRRRAQFRICAELTWLSVCAGKLLTKHSTVTHTIPSVLYARIVPLGNPYIKS